MDSSLISSPIVLAAVIAASAALGAASFAFAAALINARVARQNALLQAVIAQRMKRAEFRQQWIADLREAFTKVQVALMLPAIDKDGAENSIKSLLLINRSDPDYERLRSSIYAMLGGIKDDKESIQNARRDFILVAQDILKREWEVTKGEINHLEDDVRDLSTAAQKPNEVLSNSTRGL